MSYPFLIIITSLTFILIGSVLFTNGIEWVGKYFKLSSGAIGSVLASVGTALPETLIPLIAILLGNSSAEKEIGVGAILGAPFMLSTLTLPVIGFGVYYFARRGGRSNEIEMNFEEIRTDVKFFIISFSMVIFASTFENRLIHYFLGLLLFGIYYYYIRIIFRRPAADHLDLDALYFQRAVTNPDISIIGLQTFLGLGVMIAGAYYFINGIQLSAGFFHVSPLVLSLLITPLATELPEKFNGLIWIAKKKDHLAFSNVTGAMVFQSTFPVSIGLFGTAWRIDYNGNINILLTFCTALYFFIILVLKNKWKPYQLMGGSIAYIAYLCILLYHR